MVKKLSRHEISVCEEHSSYDAEESNMDGNGTADDKEDSLEGLLARAAIPKLGQDSKA